jgi:serine/threonine-protein kinase RsbW
VVKFGDEVTGEVASVAPLRKALRRFAQTVGFSGEALDDIECAVGEALANAVEHGSRRSGSAVRVVASMDGTALSIEVIDQGEGFLGWNNVEVAQPVFSSPRGYGIFMMREFMDHVSYTRNGSTLRLVKRLVIAADAPANTKNA